jgi:hypothetical protein
MCFFLSRNKSIGNSARVVSLSIFLPIFSIGIWQEFRFGPTDSLQHFEYKNGLIEVQLRNRCCRVVYQKNLSPNIKRQEILAIHEYNVHDIPSCQVQLCCLGKNELRIFFRKGIKKGYITTISFDENLFSTKLIETAYVNEKMSHVLEQNLTTPLDCFFYDNGTAKSQYSDSEVASWTIFDREALIRTRRL